VDLLGRGRTRVEFERFVSDHSERLLRTGYLVTLDLAEAEDLVQECLLRVARRWRRVSGMARPDEYARRVLVNLALDGRKRRTRRSRELEHADAGPSQFGSDPRASTEIAALEQRDDLLRAMAGLSRRQRVVLALRYFADLSEAQTAEALGCSLGTVKSTSSRGIAQLRQALDADGAARGVRESSWSFDEHTGSQEQ
jgi:RNA polymerase sigma-70 factor (sigma-E family)